MKLHRIRIILAGILCMFAFGLQAQNVLDEARIYVNPGHGGWNGGDRPLATINHAELDTTGFFETNTNLWKAETLRDELEKAGAGYVRMSRTQNGIVSSSPNAYEKLEGGGQIVNLSVICTDVETNNMDYFISIHSNAIGTGYDGSTTNYPLVLYRGTDAAPGNYLVDAKNMGLAAWPYINANGVTYKSYYTNSTNVRGDITFMGGSSTTTPVPGGNSYTGYYGVLRHGCEGYLVEGCFHTYMPERQRLLNKDYCRQEGLRYARAIRAWFGDDTETQGCITGTVKDATRELDHVYYQGARGNDQYYPLNGAKVVLKSGGTEIGSYTTDDEYNGLFIFTDLAPGKYELVFEAIAGFDDETAEIEVKANETAFINFRFGAEEEIDPACRDYKDPEQGGIAAASSYEFEPVGSVNTMDALEDLTVRRALLRDGKYYVLAVDNLKNPKLLVIDPETGALIKEMSTEGISTTGYNGKSHMYNLSDIGFTADGVLIGTNSTSVGVLGNSYQTGDFYVYKWEAEGTTPLEDAEPQVVITIPTNNDTFVCGPVGNNNSNFVANSIAVSGCSDDFKLYFDSHPGADWVLSDYAIYYMAWRVKNGVLAGDQRNSTEYGIASSNAESFRIALSPLGGDLILEGNQIETQELLLSWESDAIEYVADFSGDLQEDQSISGATYFKYAGKSYMSAPVCEKQADDTYSYRVDLYDITDGLDNAEKIGETEALITDEPAKTYMTAPAVVEDADIYLYLLVGDKLMKYKSLEGPGAPARVFAYNLLSTSTASGYDIRFELNADAESVDLILNDPETDDTQIIPLGSLAKGAQLIALPNGDIPEDGKYLWSIRAKADNVTQFTKISEDLETYKYFAPKSAAMDKSPESEYFGRVYITNSFAGTKDERTSQKGVYVLSPLGEDVTGQGDTAYSGDETWTGTSGQNFRKAAVAADGRIFIADASVGNSGIYIMDPSEFTVSQMFTPTRDASGRFYSGTTYIGGQTSAVGVRGGGSDTRLYAIAFDPEYSWRKYSNAYNIGEESTWSDAPNLSAFSGTYVGNDNNSIVPVSDGFWAGQYRGAGSNSAGNPCAYYYSESRSTVTFHTADPGSDIEAAMKQASQNGGLAVYEKDGLVALSYDGGVQVFQYEFAPGSNGVPTVSMKFFDDLGVSGVTYDDFEFDYAGNLYAVSTSGGFVSIWGMPTSNNTCVTPARSSLLLERGNVGIIHPEVKPVKVIRTSTGIEVQLPETSKIELYNVNGQLIERTVASGVYSRALERGVYVIRVNGKAVKFVK